MRWKWILNVALVLIGGSIFLAYLIVSSYHFNELKPRISKAVLDLTGRELTLRGDIQLKIGFRPALMVRDVRFQNASWGSRPDLVKIRRFEVQVALLPLIRGDVDVQRFILVEPDILLERDKSGKWNIGFKGKKGKKTAEVKEGEVAEEWELPLFAFTELKIIRGRLIYRDGQSAKTHRVTLDRVSAAAANTDSSVALAVKGAYRGKSFEVTGSLGPLASFVDPDKAWPLNLLAKTSGASIKANGVIKDVASAKGFSFIVTAEGQSVANITSWTDIAEVPDLGPFKVTAKVADHSGKLSVEKLNLQVGTEGLANVKLRGRVKDAKARRGLDLNVVIKGKNLTNLEKLLRRPLTLKGPFHATGRVTDLDGRLAVDNLDVQMGTTKLARVKLTGTVNDLLAQRGFDLRFAVRGRNLANVEKLLGQPIPLKGPFKVSGRVVDLGHKTYKFSDFHGALRNSDLSGSVDIKLAGKRPRLIAVLSSQKLDLRPFLPKKKRRSGRAKKSIKEAAKKEKVFRSDPLPLGVLKKVDAKIKMKAKRFLLPRLALRDLNAQMVLEKGRLRVKEIRSVIGGGTLKGRLDVRLRRKGAVVATALKIDNLDLGRMLKDLKITEILAGEVDVDMNVRGRGRSVAALMAGLSGRITLVMEGGRINNKYIDMLGEDVGSSLSRIFNASEEEHKYTELNCFVGRFEIKNGIADSKVLLCDTKRMSVVGDGEIDLRTEELDISMKPFPKKGIGISGVGKLSLSIGEFVKPHKLGGTLANPTLVIDPSQTAITIGKAFGGMMLFGPLGLAAALVTGRLGSDETCLAAIKAAKTGVKKSARKKREEINFRQEEPE